MAKGFAIHNAPTDHGGFIPATQMRSSQNRAAPDNYPNPNGKGGYFNKGKMRLKSTAVYNGTIFWSSK